MADDSDDRRAGRSAVGIYDRPAKADRFRNRGAWIAGLVVVAIVVAAVLWYVRH